MAKRTYPIMLEPAEGGYGVSFPDLPGCVSFGTRYDSAIANAEEALSLHLEGIVEDGESLPEATPLESLMLDHPDRSPQTVWALVTVEAPDASERVNIYLARSLLERIDRFVGAEGGRNRSTFFAMAARRYLEVESDPQRHFRYLSSALSELDTRRFSLAPAGLATSSVSAPALTAAMLAVPAISAGQYCDWMVTLQRHDDPANPPLAQSEAIAAAMSAIRLGELDVAIHHIQRASKERRTTRAESED